MYMYHRTCQKGDFSRFKSKYRYVIFSLILTITLYISVNTYCAYADIYLKKSMGIYDYDIICYFNEDAFYTIDHIYPDLSKINGIQETGWLALINAGYAELELEKVSQKAANYFKDNVFEEFTYCFMDDSRFEKIARNLRKNLSLYTDKDNPRAIALAYVNIYHFVKDNYIKENIKVYDKDTIDLNLYYFSDAAREKYQNDYRENPDANYLDYCEKINVIADVCSYDDLTMEFSHYIDDFHGLLLIIPISMLNVFSQDNPFSVQIYFKVQNHKEVSEILQRAINQNEWNASIMNIAESFEKEKNKLALLEIFSTIFIIVISIILTLNIFNTVISNMLLRNREFAVLRSIGMSKRSFYKMIFLEGGIWSGISIITGLILSALVSFVLKEGWGEIKMSFILPYKQIIIAVCAVLVIVLISLLFAALKLWSSNVIELIKPR